MFDSPITQHIDNNEDGDSDANENPSSWRAQRQSVSLTKEKGKVKTQWVCFNCGYTPGKWWGMCPTCKVVGTIKEFHETKLADNKSSGGLTVTDGGWLPQRPEELRPLKLEEVNRGFDHDEWRIPL